MDSETVTAHDLRRGDQIICPRDGEVETVLFTRPSAPRSTHVRTNRHDHVRPALATFELLVNDRDR